MGAPETDQAGTVPALQTIPLGYPVQMDRTAGLEKTGEGGGEGEMKNGKDPLDDIRELLRMAAAQTAENSKQLASFSKEFRRDLKASREEHNREMRGMRTEHAREMKEIRALFKKMIERIAV